MLFHHPATAAAEYSTTKGRSSATTPGIGGLGGVSLNNSIIHSITSINVPFRDLSINSSHVLSLPLLAVVLLPPPPPFDRHPFRKAHLDNIGRLDGQTKCSMSLLGNYRGWRGALHCIALRSPYRQMLRTSLNSDRPIDPTFHSTNLSTSI